MKKALLNELRTKAFLKYTPVFCDIGIYQDHGIYCHYPLYYKEGGILICSLNLTMGAIFVYLKNAEDENIKNFLLSNNIEAKFEFAEFNEEVLFKFIEYLNIINKYFSDHPVKCLGTKFNITGCYKDNKANLIEAPINLNSCSFKFSGSRNKLIIDNEARLSKVFIEFLGDDSTVEIGKKNKLSGTIRLGFNCQVSIGDEVTSTNPVYMTCAEGTKIIIGEDCMFATNNQIRTDDAHAIYDVETGVRVNKSKDIIIGKHVWIGYGATLFGGAAVGDGSIIGAHSLVKKSYPNNCILAGTPAKIIKKDIFWKRPLVLNYNLNQGQQADDLDCIEYRNKTQL